MPSALLIIAVAVFGYYTGHSKKLTLEQMDALLRKQQRQSCPENMEWEDCKDPGKPTCSNLRPFMWHPICRPGCQCKKGLYESNGKCVSDCFKEKCPGPNEVRSKCTARPQCQPNCFPKKKTKSIFNPCGEPCIPSECECEKGYIRVNDKWGYRCVSLATCEKLKKQYGSALPSDFEVM